MSHIELSSGDRIYYERIEGAADRPVLVFLHEGLGCVQMWRDFPARLCRHTGCPGLVYDRAGYGQSSGLSKPRSVHYLHEYALVELPGILSLLCSDRPYLLIGHSDGGSIGLIHAAENPPRLKGLVTEAAHVFVEPITIDGIVKAGIDYRAGKLKGLFKYHGDKTGPLFEAWHDVWLSDGFRHWNIEYLLPSVICPVLVIQGVQDQYGTVQQVQRIVSKIAGPAQMEMVEHCRHTPHLEHPGFLMEKMAYFIGEIAPTKE